MFGYIGKFLLVSFSVFVIVFVLYNYQESGGRNNYEVYDMVMDLDYEIIDEVINDLNNDEGLGLKGDDLLLELFIPRINLRENVYNIDSSLNDVSYGVEILEDSDVGINLFFLAAHSGNGRFKYFNDLVYLEKGDIIWINIGSKRLSFVVGDIFYIEKNGYFNVSYSKSGNSLFLITCSLKYSDKQLIVKAKLID